MENEKMLPFLNKVILLTEIYRKDYDYEYLPIKSKSVL